MQSATIRISFAHNTMCKLPRFRRILYVVLNCTIDTQIDSITMDETRGELTTVQTTSFKNEVAILGTVLFDGGRALVYTRVVARLSWRLWWLFCFVLVGYFAGLLSESYVVFHSVIMISTQYLFVMEDFQVGRCKMCFE